MSVVQHQAETHGCAETIMISDRDPKATEQDVKCEFPEMRYHRR
jgi:hypothetical protein